MTQLDDYTEDWPKATFDFPRVDGSTIDTLDELSGLLARDRLSVARWIATYPHPSAVPVVLMKEAYDELGR